MNKLLALGLVFALAAPAAALPSPLSAPQSEAAARPADDARCDACDALELLQNGDYRRGRHILEMRAAKGDVFAITGFGRMYQMGWGVPVDYDRAMGFYQKAAKQGDLMALNQIGYMVLNGLGRPADPKAAWCWFEEAAVAGYDRSAHHLAELMAAGVQPVSCKTQAAKAPDPGGPPAAGLELWNGVREGMTPGQVAALLPAPYRVTLPRGDISYPAPRYSDEVLAPAALFDQPAIAMVTFVDHVAAEVTLDFELQSDDPEAYRGFTRELAHRLEAAYGPARERSGLGGISTGAWRHGDLVIALGCKIFPDRPPTIEVTFRRDGSIPNRAT